MSYTALRQTLVDTLRTTNQLEEDDIATFLPEKEDEFKESDFKEKFLELDRSRIETIKERGSDKFEQGIKKGTKKALDSLEKDIRDEFGIDDDELRGLDLVKKVAELNSKKSKADPSKLSADELKSHPEIIKLLNEKEKSFKTREQELKEDFDKQLNGFKKEQTFGNVSKKALAIFESMNPVLSKDPEKAANQKNILLNDLKGINFQEDGDQFIPLDADGKRMEDPHGNGINFEKLVKSRAEKYYDFQKADPRDTPPAGGSDGGDGGSRVPKNEQEYAKMVTDKTIPLEERQQIRKDWESAKSQS